MFERRSFVTTTSIGAIDDHTTLVGSAAVKPRVRPQWRGPALGRRTLLGAWLMAAALALILALNLNGGATALRSGAAQRSLASALRADGALNGMQGSFDARGYRMVLGRGGAPRFVRVGAGASAATGAGFAGFGTGSAMAATGDNYWSDRFGMVGIAGGGTVYAVAVSGSDVYVGGRFSSLGSDNGIAANDVAMWNGHGWFPLGNGVGPSTQTVYALAVIGGKLYAGGNFTTAGSVSVNHLAVWNGSTWSDVGGGVTNGTTGQVNALVASGSTLYVGGAFKTAGTITANSIAAWNTTTSSWSSLGSGIQYCFFSSGVCSSPTTGTVNALAVSGSTLYAGGNFTDAGGQEIEGLAAWNGSAWSQVGGNAIRVGSSVGTVYSLAVNAAANTLYIGGSFDHVGGTVSNGTVTNTGVAASAVAEWNGTAWVALASGANSCCTPTAYALAYRSGRLYMAGNFSGAGGDGVPNIAQWDGSAWSAVGPGLPGYPQALVASSAGVIAGGSFVSTTDNSALLNDVGLWTGSAWKGYGLGVSNGNSGGSLNALATAGNSLYAVGSWADTGWTRTYEQGIAKFNNSSWLSVGGGVGVIYVNAVAVYGKYVFVGGQFSFSASNGTATDLAVWDGSAWHAIGSGPGGSVVALLPYDGKLWVAGTFGANCTGCAFHQLATWNLSDLSTNDFTNDGYSAVGGNPLYDGNIYALAPYTASSTSHYVIVGGSFQTLSDSLGDTTADVNSLVSYHVENTSTSSYTDGYLFFPGANGTAGVTANGIDGQVNALLVDGKNLYVGGSFSEAGAQSATSVAHCYLPNQGSTGGCWETSPGPFTSPNSNPPSIRSIVKVQTAYYLAGTFASAGGVSAPDIVQYTPSTGAFAALGSGLGAAYSGPSAVSLAEGPNGLYVGGHFGLAGAKPSENIGLWTGTALPTVAEVASATTDSAGSPVTFTTTITNRSAISWSGLTLTETLPSWVSYDSSSVSTTGGTCTASTTTPVKLTCNVGSLATAATATVGITLTPNATGTLTNTVALSATGLGFSNTAKATVTVG
jgi:uncharacterized repeat protein (TIGR01451 family)